jgi:hypothetical protein
VTTSLMRRAIRFPFGILAEIQGGYPTLAGASTRLRIGEYVLLSRAIGMTRKQLLEGVLLVQGSAFCLLRRAPTCGLPTTSPYHLDTCVLDMHRRDRRQVQGLPNTTVARSATTIRIPSTAKREHMAKPIPLAPQVTTATRPRGDSSACSC